MDFLEEELNNILNETYNDITQNLKPNKNPSAYLLGGQPGAGKSFLTNHILENKGKNIVVINADDFRKLHPRFKELYEKYKEDYVIYTQEFSAKLTEKIIDKVTNNNYNVIIEGTLRTKEVPEKTANMLKEKNYKVELYLVSVKPEISYLSTILRYENMKEIGSIPRMTPKSHHDFVVDNIANNLNYLYEQNIFNEILILNRNNDCLYSLNETPNINPSNIIDKEYKRELTSNEINYLNEKYDFVIRKKEKSNDKKEIEELKFIKKIKNEIDNKYNKWNIKNNKDFER